MRSRERSPYHAWMRDELVLVGLLGASFAYFGFERGVPTTFRSPQAYLVLSTAVVLIATIVAVLAAVRFSVDGRRADLLLTVGFLAAASGTLWFEITPVLAGRSGGPSEVWAGVGARVVAAAAIAAAAFARGRVGSRARSFSFVAGLVLGLVGLWVVCRLNVASLPPVADGAGGAQPYLMTVAVALHATLSLLAVVGFGLRFRRMGEDLDRRLALAATLALFAQLQSVFTPLLSSDYVSHGDFLRVLSYCVLLVGVWHAIRKAEFGRAVAEERARVAREIHDGLAQYLFAISTEASLIGNERLKEAAAAAQQEARFAVLALSSAGGTAPFDAALRRYVEFLTADGELEVDVEIDDSVRLGPDEQIEVFRIVQEGLANVRKHAGARHAEVRLEQEGGRRRVTIVDDGQGLDEAQPAGGQGLPNIRARAAAIGAAFKLSSQAGQGTALEVVLRA